MAKTLHVHRMIVVAPVALLATLGAWWQANADPDDDTTTWRSLNATGLWSEPETHRAANTALTKPLARTILARVCTLAGVTPPSLAIWNGWSGAEQRAWLVSTRQALYAVTGVWLDLAANEEDWDDPSSVVGGLGLKPRDPPGPGEV